MAAGQQAGGGWRGHVTPSARSVSMQVRAHACMHARLMQTQGAKQCAIATQSAATWPSHLCESHAAGECCGHAAEDCQPHRERRWLERRAQRELANQWGDEQDGDHAIGHGPCSRSRGGVAATGVLSCSGSSRAAWAPCPDLPWPLHPPYQTPPHANKQPPVHRPQTTSKHAD